MIGVPKLTTWRVRIGEPGITNAIGHTHRMERVWNVAQALGRRSSLGFAHGGPRPGE